MNIGDPIPPGSELFIQGMFQGRIVTVVRRETHSGVRYDVYNEGQLRHIGCPENSLINALAWYSGDLS